MSKSIIIIGGGFAGLSCACLLRHSGWDVTLLEKNSEWGGRARLWKEGGFSFDMGPSWYLMPEVFEAFFKLLGKDRKDYYDLEQLDPYYKVFFENEETITITKDIEKTYKLFESLEEGGEKKLRSYLKLAKYKYDTAMSEFLYKDYKSIFDFFNWKILTKGLQLNIFNTLDNFVSRFFKDHRAKKILEYAMVFLGNSPQNAPALYSIMSYVDLALGVFFPKGGLNGVAMGLLKMAEEMGVKLRLGVDVERILVEEGYAKGVETNKGYFTADAILNTGDYAHGETALLAPKWQTFKPAYWKSRVWAPSMFIVFLGVNRRLKNLEHHNLYFSKDWEEHFDKIFKNPSWPDNPCFYLSAITKTDESMAPQNCENLFLLIPVATGLKETEESRSAYLKKALNHVETQIGETFQKDIIVQRIFSLSEFEKDYHSYGGTALGLAHTLFQTAIFRPGNKSKKVKNLYYSGQYTHPGVGVPMTMISAQITEATIRKDFK